MGDTGVLHAEPGRPPRNRLAYAAGSGRSGAAFHEAGSADARRRPGLAALAWPVGRPSDPADLISRGHDHPYPRGDRRTCAPTGAPTPSGKFALRSACTGQGFRVPQGLPAGNGTAGRAGPADNRVHPGAVVAVFTVGGVSCTSAAARPRPGPSTSSYWSPKLPANVQPRPGTADRGRWPRGGLAGRVRVVGASVHSNEGGVAGLVVEVLEGPDWPGGTMVFYCPATWPVLAGVMRAGRGRHGPGAGRTPVDAALREWYARRGGGLEGARVTRR